MIRPPFAARVATGLIVTAIEEARKLPSTALTLPMTAVSQTLQAGMRLQQSVAQLAIKGDEALDAVFHRAEEEPEWAVFDDDEPAPSNTGRFALYSDAPHDVVRPDVCAAPPAADPGSPDVVAHLDYDALTLAQLRAKIRTVGLDDLRTLAEYERGHRGRAPFQTMLDNRITAAAGR